MRATLALNGLTKLWLCLTLALDLKILQLKIYFLKRFILNPWLKIYFLKMFILNELFF